MIVKNFKAVKGQISSDEYKGASFFYFFFIVDGVEFPNEETSEKFRCCGRWRCSRALYVGNMWLYVAGKRAVIFGANFITEYMLYSFLFPFPLLPVYYIPGHLWN